MRLCVSAAWFHGNTDFVLVYGVGGNPGWANIWSLEMDSICCLRPGPSKVGCVFRLRVAQKRILVTLSFVGYVDSSLRLSACA